MSAEDLLSRLDKVRKTGRGNWIARCPAHADRTPSLAIAEGDDGRILCKCFAGCSVEQILAAVGLDFEAIFPPRAPENHVATPPRLRFDPRAVLQAVQEEITVLALLSSDMAAGKQLSGVDRERMLLAADRLAEARRLAHG